MYKSWSRERRMRNIAHMDYKSTKIILSLDSCIHIPKWIWTTLVRIWVTPAPARMTTWRYLFILFLSFPAGYSRIPVYESNRQNIVTMLYIKDLALVDPDDNTLLKTLCQFYQNPCYFVFEDTTLDVLFKQFKEGKPIL